jgi:hypothetical protein
LTLDEFERNSLKPFYSTPVLKIQRGAPPELKARLR